MRRHILWLSLAVGACTTQYVETRLPPDEPLPVNQARFAEVPSELHQAFRESCQGPNDDYTTIGRTGARCRMVPPPELAAQLIVRYDGALDIPLIIVERETRSVSGGYVVSFGYFASVPLKSGNEQRVYLRSQDLDRTIDNLFRAFGGTPI